jgi:hypothetical protein
VWRVTSRACSTGPSVHGVLHVLHAAVRAGGEGGDQVSGARTSPYPPSVEITPLIETQPIHSLNRYSELDEAAVRREIKEKTAPANIQKRRKELQSENMGKVRVAGPPIVLILLPRLCLGQFGHTPHLTERGDLDSSPWTERARRTRHTLHRTSMGWLQCRMTT